MFTVHVYRHIYNLPVRTKLYSLHALLWSSMHLPACWKINNNSLYITGVFFQMFPLILCPWSENNTRCWLRQPEKKKQKERERKSVPFVLTLESRMKSSCLVLGLVFSFLFFCSTGIFALTGLYHNWENVTPRSSPSFSCARFLSVNHPGKIPQFIVTLSRDWVVPATFVPRMLSPWLAFLSTHPLRSDANERRGVRVGETGRVRK